MKSSLASRGFSPPLSDSGFKIHSEATIRRKRIQRINTGTEKVELGSQHKLKATGFDRRTLKVCSQLLVGNLVRRGKDVTYLSQMLFRKFPIKIKEMTNKVSCY